MVQVYHLPKFKKVNVSSVGSFGKKLLIRTYIHNTGLIENAKQIHPISNTQPLLKSKLSE